MTPSFPRRLLSALFPPDARRRLCELAGNDRYSHPALNDLDTRIAALIPERNLSFIELGANDGFTQSNTYYLERFRGWRGILIEPIPELYERALARRPKARVFNAACVPFDFDQPTIPMTYCNLMSVVQGSLQDDKLEADHLRIGREIQHVQSYEIDVPARTLTSIIEEAGMRSVDFLSLDVEGFELDVLKGLDFERYAPRFMLIEARFKAEIDQFLGERYQVTAQLSEMDHLYVRSGK